MKTIALCSILFLFAACVSPTAVIEGTFDCSPGQDLEIRAGLGDPLRSGEQIGQYMFLVEVANNSREDLTVECIRVEPRESARRVRGDVAIGRAQKTFNQTIPEGTEHVFELPATAFGTVTRNFEDQVVRGPIEFFVMVELTNGDAYRCPFAVERR